MGLRMRIAVTKVRIEFNVILELVFCVVATSNPTYSDLVRVNMVSPIVAGMGNSRCDCENFRIEFGVAT